MRIYLAGRYSRREELAGYAAELGALGHTVTSRWLLGLHEWPGRRGDSEFPPARTQEWAQEDLADVLAAECVVSFTERPRTERNRGGRHVELGIALGTRKLLLVIGHRENIFHTLPEIRFYETWEQARAVLAQALTTEDLDAR